MSTRSDIIVERMDGKWARIYCHFDGYLEGVGATLLKHYNSQERAEAVVAPGDMSSLAESCEKPEGHSYENRIKGYSVYYGRDRGEDDTEATVGSLIEVTLGTGDMNEFTYIWKRNEGWTVTRGSGKTMPLADALARTKTSAA